MGDVRGGPSFQSLSPAQRDIAVHALQLALEQVDEAATHITAYSARQNLALMITDSLRAGERDAIRLRDDALRVLGICSRHSTGHGEVPEGRDE